MNSAQPIVDMLGEIHWMLQITIVILGLIFAILLGSCFGRPKE
jgi:hypothetical protein